MSPENGLVSPKSQVTLLCLVCVCVPVSVSVRASFACVQTSFVDSGGRRGPELTCQHETNLPRLDAETGIG